MKLPEKPFVASRLTTTSSYHTTLCHHVEHSKRPPKHVTENELRYHELKHCPTCKRNE